jgi:hypothetical protein
MVARLRRAGSDPRCRAAGAISLAVPSLGDVSSCLAAVNHGYGPTGNYVAESATSLNRCQGWRQHAHSHSLTPVMRPCGLDLHGYTAAFFGSEVGGATRARLRSSHWFILVP